jgi:photosystem II stability/assembly factor-like uncharacterized protein
VNALVGTADGVYLVDLEDETVLGLGAEKELPPPAEVDVPLPRVVAAAAAGSTVVAVVDRRPPLLVSYDAGRTWREAGGGLPAGRAVAIAEDDPDLVLYAARNRLYVSRDGGRFWRALAVELPEIERVAFG